MSIQSGGEYLSKIFDLAGKNVLVVGGSSFLGGAVGKAIGGVGAAKVMITSRSREKAQAKAD